MHCPSLIFGKFLDGGGKAGEALELRGDDDLGGLAVGHLLHGLERFELDDLIVGAGLVEQLHRVGQRPLHGQDGLGLALGASWSSLLLVL